MPFLLVALFTGGLLARFKVTGRIGQFLQILAGGIMVLMGVAMITGQLSRFSFWLGDASLAVGHRLNEEKLQRHLRPSIASS